MRSHLIYILLLAAMWGCKKDERPAPAEGIVLNPVIPYQEAYPGSVVSFKFRVAAQSDVTGFGIRFKFPGAADYVALPQYPDVQDANAFAAFQTFEYSLPPSATDVDAPVQIRFSASAAGKQFEKEYTVQMKKSGLQNVKLYSADAATYFNFNAIDLVTGDGVPAAAADDTKDITSIMNERRFPLEDVTFNVLTGWTSTNGTRFKLVTAANYNGVATNYGTIYNGIAADQELDTLSTLITMPGNGTGFLMANQYYIAKTNRAGEVQYIGLAVKRAPATTLANAGALSKLDLTNEYLQLEIKK